MKDNEALYKELLYLGRQLRIPIPKTYLEIDIIYKGKSIRHWRRPGHTWVRNAYNLLYGQLASKDNDYSTFGAGYLSIKDTGGTTRYSATTGLAIGQRSQPGVGPGSVQSIEDFGYNAGMNVTNQGIVIGTSTQAWSFEDYHLISQIPNGNGSGQMIYVVQANGEYYYSDPDFGVKWIRYFNNNSQASIYLGEIALYGWCVFQVNFMVTRDVLSPSEEMPDASQLKVTYDISVEYPS